MHILVSTVRKNGLSNRSFSMQKVFSVFLLAFLFVFVTLIYTLQQHGSLLVPRSTHIINNAGNGSANNTGTRNGGSDIMSSSAVNILVDGNRVGRIEHSRGLDINVNLNLSVLGLQSILSDLVQEQVKKQLNDAGDNLIKKSSPTFIDTREYLLTLFTTHGDNAAKEFIYQNTLINWSKLRSVFRLVLYSDNATTRMAAVNAGWEARKVPQTSATGMPILKAMFKDVEETYLSKYYGFANADILFSKHLIDTMKVIDQADVEKNTTFITGVRTNVLHVTATEAADWLTLRNAARDRGQLFQASAEDYFITGRGYPWFEQPEVVVGMIAIDNWLVLAANARKHNVIEVTGTVLAVHQNVHAEDVFDSHIRDDARYNHRLLRNFMWNVEPPYNRGFTVCIQTFTANRNKSITIEHREVPLWCG